MDIHDIENILNNAPSAEPSPQLRDKLQNDLDKLKETDSIGPLYLSTHPQGSPWAWRYTAAALFIIGFFIGMLALDNFNSGNVAWAKVVTHSRSIQQVHFYCFEFDNGSLKSSQESWYVDGILVDLLDNGNYCVDNGVSHTRYDSSGNILDVRDSWFAGLSTVKERQNLFKVLTQGVFAYTDNEIGDTGAVDISEDFMVYRFGEPQNMKDIRGINITVGRWSLLPVQMKIFFYNHSGTYNMYVFDYEQKHVPQLVENIVKSLSMPSADN